MKSKSIEFISSDNQILKIENNNNEVLNIVSPVKELLEKRDCSSFYVVLNNEKINLNEITQIKVNIKQVGLFNFFFKQEEKIDKWQLINSLSALMETPVENSEQAKDKVNSLFKSIDGESALFVFYSPKGEFYLKNDDLRFDVNIYVIKNTETSNQIEEKNKTANFSDDGFKGLINKVFLFLAPLKENIVHYAFILVSIFLIGFSSSIGVYYCYAHNNVFYFLFVCSIVGTILDYFVYFDFFKKHKLMSNDFILTIIDIIISIGIAIGGFYIFYSLQKEIPESITSVGKIILIMIAIVIVVNAIVCPVAYFLRKRKESTTK